MNRRLFRDYVYRYVPALCVIPCYVALVAVSSAIAKDDTSLLIPFSFILVGLLSFYFTLDLFQSDTVKAIGSLPIAKQEYAQTLWGEAVAFPVIIGIIHFILGHSLLSIIAPGRFDFWLRFLPYILVALLLTNGFFVSISLIRWGTHGIRLKSTCALLMIGICFLCRSIWIFWDASQIVQVGTVFGTLAAAFYSYRMALRLVVFQSFIRKADAPPIVSSRQLLEQDFTIGWLDARMGNPVSFVVLGSTFLILLAGLMGVSSRSVLAPPEGLVSPVLFVILMFLGLTILFVLLSGSFVSSMRVFGSLPISKGRLTMACLLLPFVALLPGAFAAIFLSPILLTVYALGGACWVTCNVVYLRWNKMVAAVVLNSILVILGLWQFGYASMRAVKRPEMISLLSELGFVVTALMILVSSVWTWYLLRNSNTPYQKKPGLKMTI